MLLISEERHGLVSGRETKTLFNYLSSSLPRNEKFSQWLSRLILPRDLILFVPIYDCETESRARNLPL